MNADRLNGWLRRRFRTARRSFPMVSDGGGRASAAVDRSLAGVRLQLTVWEQRL